jgi:SulP family sulfate permease
MPDMPVGMKAEAHGGSFGRMTLVPPFQWLLAYRREWSKHDLIAGVTLAAYAVPVSLAYSSLAGLPPQHGIFCYLLGGLCYACFGTSRQLAIGPTSAISMLVGTTLAGMAVDDPTRWVAIASLAALGVAVICLLAWLLRLSVLISFISETVLLGFKAGAALTIALTQLPKLFGVPGGGEHFFERLWILGGQIPDTNFVVLSFGLVALAVLILGGRLLPGRPVALGVVVLSIIVMSISSLGEHGVTMVGELPRGLPEWKLPSLRLRDVEGVIPLAMACFLLAYIEGVSAARAIAQKRGYEINPRQELLALGAANLGVAFGQGFPVAGGLSQSAVNDRAGAKTPVALIIASTTLAICLIFLTELLKNLPNVVLASIVFVAVSGLINLNELRRLWNISRAEFRIAMVALAGVLLLGILNGVLLAVAASLLMIISRTARPHIAFLGRIPGTRRYSDLGRHPDNEPIPGVLLFRVEASLLYFNVEHVSNVVRQRLGSLTSPVRLVLCDLSTTPYVDTAGARMLSALHRDLKSNGMEFRLAEAHASVRDLLRAEGLEEQIGQIDRRISVDDIIQQSPL